MFKKLSESICLLACVIRESTEARTHEINHSILRRIEEMETRLIRAIEANTNVNVPPYIEEAEMRVQAALDELDASIPDK